MSKGNGDGPSDFVGRLRINDQMSEDTQRALVGASRLIAAMQREARIVAALYGDPVAVYACVLQGVAAIQAAQQDEPALLDEALKLFGSEQEAT